MISIKSADNYRSASSKSEKSPPSLSLPEHLSGVSNSQSKSIGRNRSNTPSYGARTDSRGSKRRIEWRSSRQPVDQLASQQRESLSKVSPTKSQPSLPKSATSRKSRQTASSNKKQSLASKSQDEGIATSDLNNEDLVIFIILT